MMIPHAVHRVIALIIAAGNDGQVGQVQHVHIARAGQAVGGAGILNADAPAGAAIQRLLPAAHIAARADNKGRHVAVQHPLRHTLGGVALGHRAQIQRQFRIGKVHRARLLIQDHLAHIHMARGLAQRCLIGQGHARLARVMPQAQHRAHGHVDAVLQRGLQIADPGKQCHQLRLGRLAAFWFT